MLVHSVEEEVEETIAVVTNTPAPSSDIDQPLKSKTNMPEADHDIITLAQERYQHNKILEAYRLLQSVKNKSLLAEPKLQEICNAAIACQNAISDLLDEPDHTAPGSAWKKQGESHGEYETTVSYKVENKQLTCRLVTPIQSDLLIPLLSVLNESDLYSDWIPSWTIPFTMGIRTSHQYAKIGTLDQIVHLIANVPWPFLPREVYIQAMVVDEIDEHDYFAVRLFTVHESDDTGNTPKSGITDSNGNHVTVPPPLPTVQRFDFDGVLLFRPVPAVDNDDADASQKMEVSFKMCVDPKISMIPVRIINFVTRTVIGTIWGQFLHVAKQVQNGERVNHKDAIQKQPELYRFIEQRVQDLFSNCRRTGGKDTTHTTDTDAGTRSKEINEANFD